MKRFVTKLTLFCFVLLTLAAVYLAVPINDTDYDLAIIEKDALLRTTPSPKLVLVGGSNLAFSVDSEVIQAQLDYPVVNMGLNFFHGLAFMLAHVQPHLSAGDIVVISPEYELLFDHFSDPDEILKSVIGFPSGLRYIRWSDLRLSGFLLALQRRIQRDLQHLIQGGGLDSDYEDLRYSFNAHGDFLAHLNKPMPDSLGGQMLSLNRPVDRDSHDLLTHFYEDCRSRGIELFITFPPFPIDSVEDATPSYDFLRTFDDTLSSRIISHPKTYILPRKHFFDSAYHLNEGGRAIRTERLIQDLKVALEKHLKCIDERLFYGQSCR